jgi:hypothetical protein
MKIQKHTTMKIKYFSINGYWKDDQKEFKDYIATNREEHNSKMRIPEEGIFYYGLTENRIKNAIDQGYDHPLEFVITSYTKL